VDDYARFVMASDDVHYPLRRVQSIVMKLEKLTPKRAVSVAKRAARFGAIRPDAVARIIEEHLDLGDQPSDGFLDPRWAQSPRFARDAAEFLAANEGPHASA
jgi:hypothetical protein